MPQNSLLYGQRNEGLHHFTIQGSVLVLESLNHNYHCDQFAASGTRLHILLVDFVLLWVHFSSHTSRQCTCSGFHYRLIVINVLFYT